MLPEARRGTRSTPEFVSRIRLGVFGSTSRYWLTRIFFLRGLGFIYAVAFLSLALQLRPLIGIDGLLPAAAYLERLRAEYGSLRAYFSVPTVFWFVDTDAVLVACAWLGFGLSTLVIAGYANSVVLLALWLLYLSFVHIGQIFYGYGWEMLLLETGFLAVFLAPPWRLSRNEEPPRVVVWMLRWVLFRLMFGAGLIKVRGDACWTELTCLYYHYETQPLPNPLSRAIHHAPRLVLTLGVAFNHVVELIVPFGYFAPARVRHVAGVLTVIFQLCLILSGNLSFLNWLTLVIALACFDDRALSRLVPRRWLEPLLEAESAALPLSRSRRSVLALLVFGVGVLSINPLVNLLSPTQRMNEAYDPFHLVNSYGAFGSVSRRRYEVVLEGCGTSALDTCQWREYELPCKPGDVQRRPCVVAPYQLRLDWQMWFAALGTYEQQPWIVHLMYKLLSGERAVKTLLASDPFPERPPKYVRALLYEYQFSRPGEEAYWRRTLVGEYVRPVALHDAGVKSFLSAYGWVKP